MQSISYSREFIIVLNTVLKAAKYTLMLKWPTCMAVLTEMNVKHVGCTKNTLQCRI